MKFALVSLLGVIAAASEAEFGGYRPHAPHPSRSSGRYYGVSDRSFESSRRRGGSRSGRSHAITIDTDGGLGGQPGVPGLRGAAGVRGLGGAGAAAAVAGGALGGAGGALGGAGGAAGGALGGAAGGALGGAAGGASGL